jgi:hypothetical protein
VNNDDGENFDDALSDGAGSPLSSPNGDWGSDTTGNATVCVLDADDGAVSETTQNEMKSSAEQGKVVDLDAAAGDKPKPKPKPKRKSLSLAIGDGSGADSLPGPVPADKSYTFGSRGAMQLRGFVRRVSASGFDPAETVPITDRMVRLFKLGQGASGTVYKALDLRAMRLVALKEITVFDDSKRRQLVHELGLLHDHFMTAPSPSTVHEFDLHSRPAPPAGSSGVAGGAGGSSLAVACPHIVAFFDAFASQEQGKVSMAIEYMDGGSLQDIVDGGGEADQEVLAHVAAQSLEALRFMHEEKQLMHRDIKVGTVMLCSFSI